MALLKGFHATGKTNHKKLRKVRMDEVESEMSRMPSANGTDGFPRKVDFTPGRS